MSNSKRQSLIIIGFGLLILAGIMVYFALSMPKVADEDSVSLTVTTTVSEQQNTGPSANTQNSKKVQVNLNTCTVNDLIAINGIGEKKASAIIEYRDVIGGYTSVDEIKNIKGIGDKIFEKISPYLCV